MLVRRLLQDHKVTRMLNKLLDGHKSSQSKTQVMRGIINNLSIAPSGNFGVMFRGLRNPSNIFSILFGYFFSLHSPSPLFSFFYPARENSLPEASTCLDITSRKERVTCEDANKKHRNWIQSSGNGQKLEVHFFKSQHKLHSWHKSCVIIYLDFIA